MVDSEYDFHTGHSRARIEAGVRAVALRRE